MQCTGESAWTLTTVRVSMFRSESIYATYVHRLIASSSGGCLVATYSNAVTILKRVVVDLDVSA